MSLDDFNPDTLSPPKKLSLAPVTLIVLCAIALAVIGLVTILSATSHLAPTPKNPGMGPYFYFNKQLMGLALAFGAALVTGFLPFEKLRRFTWPIAIGALLLLAAVFLPYFGVSVKGSRRWVQLAFIRIQVSEVAKIVLVFVLAHYLALNQARLGGIKNGFIAPVAIIVAFVVLVGIEPDLGSAAFILIVGMTLFFLAGMRLYYLGFMFVTGSLAFVSAVLLMPNRFHRIAVYWKIKNNPGPIEGHQLDHSLAAFAYGGETGVGLGQGRQQLNFLPEAHTDFIFAVLGEELGLWATLTVTILFLVIFICGYLHLRRAPNMFQYLLVAGALLLLSLQAIINLGVVTGLFPTKGMSLPFISAGLSNLILMGVIVGIFINTHRAWNRLALDTTDYEITN